MAYKTPAPHTIRRCVYDAMKTVIANDGEVSLSNAKGRDPKKPVRRSSINLAIIDNRKRHFPEKEFYTYTTTDGQVMLGLRKE